MEEKWTQVSEEYVLFEYPCQYENRCHAFNLPGENINNAHGHIKICTEEGGHGIVPAQVESREFLVLLLKHTEEVFTLEERDAILRHPETEKLFDKMTEREIEVAKNPELMKKWTTFGIVYTW